MRSIVVLSVPQARLGTEEARTGSFPSPGPRPMPGQGVSSLEPQCRQLQAISLRVPLRTVAPCRRRTWPVVPADPLSLPSHSVHPELCVARMRRLSTPQQRHSCARSGWRSGLTVPGQTAWPQDPSRSASRLGSLSGLVPSAVSWGSCRDSLCSGGPSICTVGPDGPCSCRSVISRAYLPEGTAGSQVLPLCQCPRWCLLQGRCHGGDRQVDGWTGGCPGAQEQRGAGWVD